MKIFTILTFLFVLCAIIIYGQEPSIYGAYEFCAMACKTIQIKPDHTFILQFDGDLHSHERYYGKWVLIDHNKIHAIIPENHSPMKVSEEKVLGNEYFSVEVRDESGIGILGVVVKPLGSLSYKKFVTNEAGVVIIPICDEFELSILSYRSRFHPTENYYNKFSVTLTNEQISTIPIDEIWLIEKGRLYIENEEGVIDKKNWLEKISKKRELEIFKNN